MRKEDFAHSESRQKEAFEPKMLNYFTLEPENWFCKDLSMHVPLAVQLSSKTQIWNKGKVAITVDCTDLDVVRASCSCLKKPVQLFFSDILNDASVRLKTKQDRVLIHQVEVAGTDAVQYIANQLKRKCTMPLYGLVLAGGKSTRMGKDKVSMRYHGNMPQYEYIANLMQPFCEKVFFSASDAENSPFEGVNEEHIIYDEFSNLGPLSGILTAFKKYPNTSFLVMAVDLPLADEKSVRKLTENRNSNYYATCYGNSEGEPEPLFAIWEGTAYPLLLKSFLNAVQCPRSILKSVDYCAVRPDDSAVITNVNTPEEAEIARLMIKKAER